MPKIQQSCKIVGLNKFKRLKKKTISKNGPVKGITAHSHTHTHAYTDTNTDLYIYLHTNDQLQQKVQRRKSETRENKYCSLIANDLEHRNIYKRCDSIAKCIVHSKASD